MKKKDKVVTDIKSFEAVFLSVESAKVRVLFDELKTPKHALYSHFRFIQFLVERETFICSASGFFLTLPVLFLFDIFCSPRFCAQRFPPRV